MWWVGIGVHQIIEHLIKSLGGTGVHKFKVCHRKSLKGTDVHQIKEWLTKSLVAFGVHKFKVCQRKSWKGTGVHKISVSEK